MQGLRAADVSDQARRLADLPWQHGHGADVKGKLKCRTCGSKEIRTYAPFTKDDALMFEAGDRLPEHTRAI